MSFADELRKAATASGLKLDDRIVAACVAHFDLLVRWNKTHNLTRITDAVEAVRRHYLDCLVPLLQWEAPGSFVDVGSGAGFPGLMAALAWPRAKATLVEPASKRVSFLRLAADAMGVELSIVAPGQGSGERVLSRATFPPGEREELVAYAIKGEDAAIAVWGHPNDEPTWSSEVVTWGAGWRGGARTYQVVGLEERALLTASLKRG